MNTEKTCPDCGVEAGALHHDGCDVERCPQCGCQKISCEESTLFPRIPWSGQGPGVMECEEFGWWCIRAPIGWSHCDKNEPGAVHDINRLCVEGVWNPEKQRFMKRT